MARIEYTDVDGKVHRIGIPGNGDGIVIGRSPSCNVVLDSKSVGRNHGKISREDGDYVYRDLGSVNGSFIDDQRVKESVVLSDGARVRCGDARMDFVLEPGDENDSSSKKGGPDKPPSTTATVSRLQKENKALRAELKSFSDQLSQSDPAELEGLRKMLGKSKSAQQEVEDEVRHLQGLVEDGERRVKDAETRAATANSSLESVHAKYMDMRDQVQHSQDLLEETRSNAADAEVEVADLKEQVASLTARAEAAQNRRGQAAEEVSDLKVKVTEKEREIERLQRDVDIRDYDLKALKEDNERLQEYCETDTGQQAALERKTVNLEAVIEENRNYIAELRRNNEEKDRELREVRLGVGIADLEQEKQRLLDDFHKKSREVDDLKSDLAARCAELEGLTSERDELQTKLKKGEEKARTRKAEREDISDHPEYRARVREVERLTRREQALSRDLGVLRGERDRFSDEERARLEAELGASQEKSQVLAERIETIRKERGADDREKAPEKVVDFLSGVYEDLESLLDGFVVLNATMKDVLAFLDRLSDSSTKIPKKVSQTLGDSSLEEAIEAVRSVQRVLSGDIESLKKAWVAGEPLWKKKS